MELRRYWGIVYGRLWAVGLVVAVAVAASLATRKSVRPAYQVYMRIILGIVPEAREAPYYTYDRYYAWLSSDYLVDDFSEVVKGQAFAEAVAARLKGGGLYIPAGAISAEKRHRILTLTLIWGNPDEAQALGEAIADALLEEGARFFAQLAPGAAEFRLIDGPRVSPVAPGLREKLDLPLRWAIALVAGVGLAFLLEYLDDTVRSAEELEAMGLKVLGTIPAARPWWRKASRFRP